MLPAQADLAALLLAAHILMLSYAPPPSLPPPQTFTMMIISRWIFNRFGWGMAALITPTVLLLTGERQWGWGARVHALGAGAQHVSPGVRWYMC